MARDLDERLLQFILQIDNNNSALISTTFLTCTTNDNVNNKRPFIYSFLHAREHRKRRRR